MRGYKVGRFRTRAWIKKRSSFLKFENHTSEHGYVWVKNKKVLVIHPNRFIYMGVNFDEQAISYSSFLLFEQDGDICTQQK